MEARTLKKARIANRDMGKLIDAYLPTIHTDWAELRAVCRNGASLQVRLAGSEWIALRPTSEDAARVFFRHRFTGLQHGTFYRVELKTDAETKIIPLTTLTPLAGPKKVRFAILTDLHIQPHACSRGLSSRARRLYAVAEELAFRYLKRIEQQGADLVIFPGDTFDPLDDYTLGVARELMRSVDIPCHLMIGNHEAYGPYDERDFHRAFDLPRDGYQTILFNDVAFILLSTPQQRSLHPSGRQFCWLESELERHANRRDTFVFAHFSLLLHPCVQGWKNDGMQQLDDYQSVLDLLSRYRRVRAFIAGHKNVPSRQIRDGVLHLLCPQLIQAPCGYSMIELFENGLLHNVYEINEQPYVQIARDSYGNDYAERYGGASERNYVYRYP
jgi:hypothetical protein